MRYKISDLQILLNSYEKALAANNAGVAKLKDELSKPQTDRNRRAALRYAVRETEAANLELETAIAATRAQIQALEGSN